MRGDLLDAQSAVDWAVAQLPVLIKRIIKWKRDEPYTTRIDTDSEPGKKVYRLTNVKTFDPLINAEAGVIIHSIRSSLDILACALAARNGFPESRSTHFPMAKAASDFSNPQSHVVEQIKRLSDVDKSTIIKDCRPYPGGDDLLCALHALDLTRKHRRLLDALIFTRGVSFSLAAPITYSGDLRFQDEAIVGWTDDSVPDGKITVGLHVAFDESGPLHGHEVPGTITAFARKAFDIVRLFN
ncbi:MAG: hypothetical protein KGO48_13580 [Alphaproteobacteria bacterium]|nr:hypothetical protein [Alphaproteobacteria bacterium]